MLEEHTCPNNKRCEKCKYYISKYSVKGQAICRQMIAKQANENKQNQNIFNRLWRR